jgi:hypothetical protein
LSAIPILLGESPPTKVKPLVQASRKG